MSSLPLTTVELSERTACLDDLRPGHRAHVDAVLATRTRDDWIARFDAAGVPVGPVNSIGEALAHPQAIARGMVAELVHPRAGPTRALGCPIHFSATPTAITRPAPLLGLVRATSDEEAGELQRELDGQPKQTVRTRR